MVSRFNFLKTLGVAESGVDCTCEGLGDNGDPEVLWRIKENQRE